MLASSAVRLLLRQSSSVSRFQNGFRIKASLLRRHQPHDHLLHRYQPQEYLLHHRCLHTSKPRLLHPAILVLVKPVSKLAAALFGRQFRRWYKRLDDEERAKLHAGVKRWKHLWAAFGASIVGLFGYLYYIHLEICPITKRRKFVALKPHQIEQIAEMEFEQLLTTYKDRVVAETHPVYDRIAEVATRILKANKDFEQLQGKTWTVTVINDDDISGILQVCNNNDQLGIILSHEIAHCLLNHVAENLSYLNLVNFIILIPLALIWAILPTDGIALITDYFFAKVADIIMYFPFSRRMEAEADEVGLRMAAKACLDVREAPAFWGKMSILEKTDQAPELVSTHPAHENRRQNLMELLPEALDLRTQCNCYRLSGPDPNNAFQRWAEHEQKLRGIRTISVNKL